MTVAFSTAVDETSALNPGNYIVTGVSLSGVTLDGNTATLTLSTPLPEDVALELSVDGVLAVDGIPVLPFSATLELDLPVFGPLAGDPLRTEVELDDDGRPIRVYDPRGVVASPKWAVAECDYDLPGRPLQSRSPDAGTRWALDDARGRPFLRWDARGETAMISSNDSSRLVNLLWSCLLTAGGLACQQEGRPSAHATGAAEAGASQPGASNGVPSGENDAFEPPQGSEGPFIEAEDTYQPPQEGPATNCPDAGSCDQGEQALDWWLWRAVDKNWGILEISAAKLIEESVPEFLADGTVTIPWIRLTARFEIHELFSTGPTGLAPDAPEWQYVGPKPGCYPPQFSDAFTGTEADRATYVTPCVDLPGAQNVFDGGRYVVLVTGEGFVWAFPVVDGAIPADATLTGSGATSEEISARISEFKSGSYAPPK